MSAQTTASSQQKEIVFPYQFDADKRRKSKIYMKQKLITGLLNGLLVPALFLVFLLFSGWHVALEKIATTISPLLAIPIFMFLLVTLTELVEFPLGFYSSYLFEHKYKLSNYTLSSWFKDFFKGLLLTYIISIILFSVIFFLISNFSLWWVYAWVILMVFQIFMSVIYPVIIFPFFYKTQPYENKKQVAALLKMVKQAGVKNINRVVLAKESEKSKKPNAMFAGLGKTKTMVLFDTLTENFTANETQTVVGHELGHYVGKDTVRFIVIEAVLLLPTLYTINLLLTNSVGLLGIASISSLAIFPIFLLGSLLIEFGLDPLVNAYSRKRELAADLFALNTVQKPLAQISTEKRLADMSLSDHQPNRLVELLFFTHPSAEKRINLCYDWAQKNNMKLD